MCTSPGALLFTRIMIPEAICALFFCGCVGLGAPHIFLNDHTFWLLSDGSERVFWLCREAMDAAGEDAFYQDFIVCTDGRQDRIC